MENIRNKYYFQIWLLNTKKIVYFHKGQTNRPVPWHNCLNQILPLIAKENDKLLVHFEKIMEKV